MVTIEKEARLCTAANVFYATPENQRAVADGLIEATVTMRPQPDFISAKIPARAGGFLPTSGWATPLLNVSLPEATPSAKELYGDL